MIITFQQLRASNSIVSVLGALRYLSAVKKEHSLRAAVAIPGFNAVQGFNGAPVDMIELCLHHAEKETGQPFSLKLSHCESTQGPWRWGLQECEAADPVHTILSYVNACVVCFLKSVLAFLTLRN